MSRHKMISKWHFLLLLFLIVPASIHDYSAAAEDNITVSIQKLSCSSVSKSRNMFVKGGGRSQKWRCGKCTNCRTKKGGCSDISITKSKEDASMEQPTLATTFDGLQRGGPKPVRYYL
jgi:hypothetical protein